MTTPESTAAHRDVFFVSDSTGITAETLGRALLANFPGIRFRTRTVPFLDTVDAAHRLAEEIDEADEPLVFTTVKSAEVADALREARSTQFDLIVGHLTELERALDMPADPHRGQFHAQGDLETYFARMRAVEYAIEHDDGQSSRALAEAEVIIIAPSRCGKTPTTMYLALQHGLRVANYPLTEEDFSREELPAMLAPHRERLFGLTTTPMRLSQVRHQRRPDSTYASLAQCTRELRRAEDLYRRFGIPHVDSATKSVEEMAALILQRRSTPHRTPSMHQPKGHPHR